MPSSAELYPLVYAWIQALPASTPLQATALSGLAHLVTALLVGQSLRPSALMRALLSPSPVPARQRYKRVARAWSRPWLSPAWLGPRLIPAVLALVAADQPTTDRSTTRLTHLALDSVRCGPWEVFTLGVIWHGRVLPVGWAVLAYPWPKGQFTPTVLALIRQVGAVWPTEQQPVHLVADRAFPSRAMFRLLADLHWGWTIRLRAASWVSLAGQRRGVRSLLAESHFLGWTTYRLAQYASGLHEPLGTVVVGRGLLVLPPHQRGPASLRIRLDQHGRRQAHVAHKHPKRRPDASPETDAWLVLFSSHTDWKTATTSYARRWAIEGSYRDAQGGWDGQHGWDLEPVLTRLTEAATVERVVGLWALGSLLQTWVGVQLGRPAAGPVPRAIQHEWTTTGRLSVWARGRCALTEPTGRLRSWLQHTLSTGAERVATGACLLQQPLDSVPQLGPAHASRAA
jgi:hypothetical protein